MKHKLDIWQILLSAAIVTMLLAVAVLGIPGMVNASQTASHSQQQANLANYGSTSENGSAGFFGIGTNTPTRILTVTGTGPGTVPWFQRGTDSAGFIIERTPENRWVLGVNESPALGKGFVLSTYPVGAGSSTPRLMVDLNGRVGINTTTPDSGSMLTVVSNDPTAQSRAIYGQATAPGDTWGVIGVHNDGVNNNYGYLGGNNKGVIGTGSVAGVFGTSGGQHGVWGYASNPVGGYGVYGQHSSGSWGGLADNWTGVSGSGASSGVSGTSTEGDGVLGWSTSGPGVRGRSNSGYGLEGSSTSGIGVSGTSNGSSAGVAGYSNTGNGIFGQNTGGGGYAGYFQGNVWVQGSENITGNLDVGGILSKASGTFKIDHPQDPENKYLQHSFVESPEMMNIYRGNVLLDGKGEASVDMPAYFEALNRDFAYQLTCIGGYAPVYIAEKITGNRFKIAGGKAGLEVSWQVTGVRKDAFANAHPIAVEQEKAAGDKGLYLHPKEWGQPESKGIGTLNKP